MRCVGLRSQALFPLSSRNFKLDLARLFYAAWVPSLAHPFSRKDGKIVLRLGRVVFRIVRALDEAQTRGFVCLFFPLPSSMPHAFFLARHLLCFFFFPTVTRRLVVHSLTLRDAGTVYRVSDAALCGVASTKKEKSVRERATVFCLFFQDDDNDDAADDNDDDGIDEDNARKKKTPLPFFSSLFASTLSHTKKNKTKMNSKKQPPRFLLFGGTGWIGGLVSELLTAEGATWKASKARLEDRALIQKEFEEVRERDGGCWGRERLDEHSDDDDIAARKKKEALTRPFSFSSLDYKKNFKIKIQFKPTHVLNAAGITGRPNVDWCETHKVRFLFFMSSARHKREREKRKKFDLVLFLLLTKKTRSYSSITKTPSFLHRSRQSAPTSSACSTSPTSATRPG